MYRSGPIPRSVSPGRLAVSVSFVIALGFTVFSFRPALRAQAPGSEPLLHAGSLRYLGAFRLPGPTGSSERDTFGYGGEAMAFDAYRDSLWVTGHDWYDRLAEVTIPTPNAANPPVASFKTSWIDMIWRNQLASSQVNMGGIFPLANGDLILSAYVYYDATGSQRVSHVRRRSNGTITSAVQVGNFGAGFVSGYMTPVPAEWQPLLGGPALTGNSSLSIISRTSLGPAAAVFNPDDVGSLSPVPATQVLGYPINHPTLGTCDVGTVAGEFNCGAANNRAGIVWPAGTRSILYFHRLCANGQVTYNAGYHCPRGRVTQVMAIDANDLVDVREGRKQPWNVKPYATWNLGPPLANARLTAVTYDPARKWVFVSQEFGDGTQPMIHVYEVDAAASIPPGTPVPPGMGGLPKSSSDPAGGLRRSASYTGGSARFAKGRAGSAGQGDGDDRPRDGDGARDGGAPRDGDAVSSPRTGGRTVTPPPAFCADANPYPNRDGFIGVCVEGQWKLVAGVRSSGVLRRGRLGKSGEVWLIESEGTTYQIANTLDEAYQEEGLEVAFEGVVASSVPRRWPGAVAIDLRQLSILPRR